ncbi:GNAT family N-acetyltransferase [Saccharopolyspora erythraea]|uniref:helix-turn-helix domain-containing GNAT family N-acetyltransferase n=1 Tax=Saccharopolyspora erythraea TaxID=1836 RepID=UPI001BAA694C|nr:GNAT family N-acetyltransferase [Saccharopolyspora erythraea]QUH01509.1 GNAT family N-acetyltransferase [Saccharopolyspora erythraea]
MPRTSDPAPLGEDTAVACAERFACLADPTRVRLLYRVAVAGRPVAVGELARELDVSEAACSGHLRRLADGGFVLLRAEGAEVTDPHVLWAALVRQKTHGWSPRVADDIVVRALRPSDWPDVRRIYAEGIETGNATFETEVPDREALEVKWLPGHRWVAEAGGRVAGWGAATAASSRPCYSGVVETSLYVGAGARGSGVGNALLRKQIEAADADGLWTLQTAIFPENLASIALHRAAGFRTVGVRERIARHHGVWRDTVILERRRPDDDPV